MYNIHVGCQQYGPFSFYSSALAFARERWVEKEFYITGPHSDEICA